MFSESLAAARRWNPSVSLIVACGCAIALLSFGVRSSMGLFQVPILNTAGWSFTTFGLAMALQNISWGIGQPIFGAIADRFGAWKTLAVGGLCYAAGLYIMGTATAPIWLHIGGGILVGLGVAAGSFGIIMSVFARNVAPEQRSFVFGIGTAAGSAGMFVFAPISRELLENFGWSHSLILLSVIMLLVPILAAPLYGNARSSMQSAAEIEQTLSEAFREALHHRSYVLLNAGFFVCGFHVAFIAAHFPAYISDIGVAEIYAAYALALIGFFNIFGSLGAGYIGQKYSKPKFLTIIYIARAIAIFGFMMLPQNSVSVIIFAILMGRCGSRQSLQQMHLWRSCSARVILGFWVAWFFSHTRSVHLSEFIWGATCAISTVHLTLFGGLELC